MLDIGLLKAEFDTVHNKLKTRNFDFDIAEFTSLEKSRKILQVKIQELQELRNKNSKTIGIAKQKGEDIQALKIQVEQANVKLSALSLEQNLLQEKMFRFLHQIPNLPHESVPVGKDENDNIEVAKWGTPTIFNFTPKDHIQLIEDNGFYNHKDAVKISGSRFAVLKGELAMLHRVIAQYMLGVHTANGYLEVNIPTIVNQNSLFGTGQLPKFEKDIYKIQKEDNDKSVQQNSYYLIPTAEVPLTNLVANTTLDSKDLPIKMVAHSCCYRSEAGSYGRDVRGLIRQHQFEKVELVHIVAADQSFVALEELTENVEKILQSLELPYRKVVLSTGDMGFAACKTYDLEVWIPTQNTYREISSCSNTLDFQARRMQAKYKNKQGKLNFVHCLNGSGLAVGRTLVAILENYQQENGKIKIPKVLLPYMNGKTEI